MTTKTFEIKKGELFLNEPDNPIFNATEFIEDYFDDDVYLGKDHKFKKNHKIIITIK